MSSSSRRLVGALVLAFGLLGGAPAWADPSPSDVESAKAQFAEGSTFEERTTKPGPPPLQGRVRPRSFADHGPRAGSNAARSGANPRGRATLLEAASMPKKPAESEKAAEAREEAAKLADEAKVRLASVQVTFDSPPRASR